MPKYRKGDRVLLKNGETALITQTYLDASPSKYKTRRDNYKYRKPFFFHGESDMTIKGLFISVSKAWKGWINAEV